jgi:PAP2 superfamily
MSTISITWAESALKAIRHIGAPDHPDPKQRARIGPPMVARSLAILHTAIYDAWAIYDPQAMPTQLRLPSKTSGSDSERIRAMSQAAYQVLRNQFPTETTIFDATMASLGFPTNATTEDANLPEGVGNLAAKAVLAYTADDGANQRGNLTESGKIYADYTGYASVNPPIVPTLPTASADIPNPDRWQPLGYEDAVRTLQVPSFIGPHWEKVRPFALSSAEQFRPSSPAELTSQSFLDQARHVIGIQERLETKHKVIAEYWADGPSSELPPGHWELFAIFISNRDSHTLHQDAKMFFALANAIHDAAIATWEAKRYYDYVRPVTAIRHLFRGKKIKGWDGGSIVTIKGESWRPYQVPTFPTPPFPEFTSGHSGFSMAAAEVLKRFTGSDAFGASYTQSVPLRVEPTLAAAVGVTLKWDTFTEAALEAGESRLYGGIHFYEGNVAGLSLGRKIGAQTYDKAQGYWSGRV